MCCLNLLKDKGNHSITPQQTWEVYRPCQSHYFDPPFIGIMFWLGFCHTTNRHLVLCFRPKTTHHPNFFAPETHHHSARCWDEKSSSRRPAKHQLFNWKSWKVNSQKNSLGRVSTGWWFQPIWKILVKMGIFPR